MSLSVDIEAQRLKNLQEKQRLLQELNLHDRATNSTKPDPETKPRAKKRRSNGPTVSTNPSRTSARIAAGGTRISYNEEGNGVVEKESKPHKTRRRQARSTGRSRSHREHAKSPSPTPSIKTSPPSRDLATLVAEYSDWQPSAPAPTLQANGTYHFASHPSFTPNKSPLSILLEGAFGGSYFSPWHSRTLGLTLHDDHLTTLPGGWLAELTPARKYLTSPAYDASLNKHGVACGQTLSQWEDAGWMNFDHDPRGWFEWYIRFWLGRRCDDGEDERQVGRWVRCAGPKGRWKRVLLKRYLDMGVTSVFDDGDDAAEKEVSPVVHQTCHHWAYQVCQEDLDEAWRERGARP